MFDREIQGVLTRVCDRYQCEPCGGKKRDAVRYTSLDILPPVSSFSLPPPPSMKPTPPSQVLHFSLLRFVFQPKDFTRAKSNHAISYPLRLDMGKYLNGGKGREVWYDLKGVLMHKGQSAHHGHYVAQVHDALLVIPFFLREREAD